MWNKDIKFKDPVRQNFMIRDFTGGICNTKSPLRLRDNQCLDMLNICFDQEGVLRKRSGVKDSNDAPISVDVGNETLLNAFILEPNPNEYGYLVHTTGGFIYYTANPDDYGDANRKFIPWNRTNTYQPISGVQFLNKFYFVDGGLSIMYFDLNELETLEEPNFYHIIKPPSGFTPTPKPATKGVTNQAIVSGETYPHINIWYEPCESELEDGFKGSNMCEVKPTFIKVHGDRLYLAGNKDDPNMVYISDILNPLYLPASLPIQTPPVGDRITGLHVFSDSLVIGRRDSVYVLFGDTNRLDVGTPYVLRQINTHTGIANQNCTNIVNDYLFYVGTNGQCYKMQTTKSDISRLTTTQLNLDFDFTLPPLALSVDEIRACHTGFNPVDNEWYVQLGEHTVVYNYKLMAWTRYNNIDNTCFITIDNKFYIVGKDGAFNIFDSEINYDVLSLQQTLNIPIACYWKSKTIDFGTPTRIKQIRDTYLVSESWGDFVSDIEVKYEIDYVEITKKQSVQNEVALWNKAIFGKTTFISDNIVRSLPIMVGRRGRTFGIEIKAPYEYCGIFNDIPSVFDTNNMDVGSLIYLKDAIDGSPDSWYIKTEYNLEKGTYWDKVDDITYYFQPMKIYELSGTYELKGYR
ncbi:hypothetical protein [Romboutsia sp.]|uniref:hypothetical protein n=1 Tax=Romboutsia sp. TaxID=1965302 RepID=UPI002C42783D|nr:hypothetical protein [Romboutsia sp.]HSQ90155.1 hypothetical protein [Romboutsia sp.]